MEFLSTQSLANLLVLTGIEIVLGIDNVIFIAILVQHLEKAEKAKARVIGLSLALVMRVLMLFSATSIMKLTDPLFKIFAVSISGRDLLLLIGGLFLIVKAIMEIFEMLNAKEKEEKKDPGGRKFMKIISQIIFIDVVLSFDSIITAVGISNELSIMVIAVVISMIVMLISANSISKFIERNPSIKVLALAFIALVGAMLFLNGLNFYFDKAYIYFAFFFSGIVEFINIKLKNKKDLHK